MENKPTYTVKTKRVVSLWLCCCGEPLGYVIEVDGVRRLRAGDVFLEGKGHVRCPVCGRWKKWFDSGDKHGEK